MPDKKPPKVLNDPWDAAVHEAGHAVISRVLNMACGDVTIIPDFDDGSAGHALIFDPWEIAGLWERQNRYRKFDMVLHGRIMAMMAGAIAETVLIGHSQDGADGDDQRSIALMFEECSAGDVATFERLQRFTQLLCRRHAARIQLVAEALRRKPHLSDDEVRDIINLPKRPEYSFEERMRLMRANGSKHRAVLA